MGAHPRESAALHLCELRRRLQAARPGSSGRAAARGWLRDAAATLWDLEADIGADQRALWRSLRPADGIRASFLGVRTDGPRDREPELPPRPEPYRPHGSRRGQLRARQHARCGRRLRLRGGRRFGHRVAAARTAPALQCLQHRLRRHGQHPRYGEWAAEKVPGFRAEIVPQEEADIVQDPTLRDGMWGAYDISRLSAETGWKPRPMREALHAYMDWIAAERNSNTWRPP